MRLCKAMVEGGNLRGLRLAVTCFLVSLVRRLFSNENSGYQIKISSVEAGAFAGLGNLQKL